MHLISVIFFFIGLSCSITTPVPDTISRIVNGDEVDIRDVPYQAILKRLTNLGWSFSCGASVITTRFLLTAAHCVNTYESEPENLQVTAGSSSRSSGGRSYDVIKVIPHQGFSSERLINDIAMVATATKMTLSPQLNPVDIPNTSFYLPEDARVLVSGFGVTSFGGEPSTALRAAYINVVPQAFCRKAYRGITEITNTMLCASADDPPRDACQGDSGGPLVYQNTIVGIVSFGEGCANMTYPGVYTRVSAYSSWILYNLAAFNSR